MIGRIKGKLDYISDDHIIVDVGGVGYIIYVTKITLSNLPTLGEKLSLFTELIVKEDLLQLVGFITPYEREWYKLLTSVQGVGSKAALALLSQIPIQTISRSILLEDSATITSAQGIGPKIAKRLVVELKGKVVNQAGIFESGKNTAIATSEKDSWYQNTKYAHLVKFILKGSRHTIDHRFVCREPFKINFTR